ncbi:claudin domain-containing protein 2 isoform X1 [Nematostella vectensis]|uniref:claudin domain-containing protein 2 isoform X1 n=1 Tax=Nematostella vectensis TaxID=45351 RepID=UPI0020770907|nr:claudin domain-containing protein 2 isoform X1 [Nematostella vectensis]
MIKIITTFMNALTAMLMGCLCLATDYWKVWWEQNTAANLQRFNNEGLFFTCNEGVIRNATSGVTYTVVNHQCAEMGTRFDWTGAVIAFLVLALLCHFVAFVLAMVNACRKGEPFPVFWVCGLFMIAAIFVIIGLLVYTFSNWKNDVYFSWSYGGGWSTVALSIIAFVLIMADR